MSRSLTLLAVLGLVSCSPRDDSPTLLGEPVHDTADPNEIIETIDVPNLPNVLLTAANGEVALGIYQAKTGQPHVTLKDANGDGVIDLITYASLSENGDLLAEVEDYGMDGQPDFIVDYQTNSGSIFYLGAWRDVSGLGGGGTPTIEVDGERREIEDVLAELGRGAF